MLLNMETKNEIYHGSIEIEHPEGEFHVWEVAQRGNTLIVGTACNVGWLEDYAMEIEKGESLQTALEELLADLEVEARDGPDYMSRLK